MRVPFPLEKAHRLINSGPVVLVSSASGGQENVMAAAWCMAIDFSPPKLCVVIAEGTHTRKLVDESQALVVQVPTRQMLPIVDGVGTTSGREVDKWERFAIGREREPQVAAPLISGCNAWLACQVIPGEQAIQQRYDLFVCGIVAAWVDDAVFQHGHLVDDVPAERAPVHHVAGGVYVVEGAQARLR